MSNEPKNPYNKTTEITWHTYWQEGYDACQSHLRSLIGEKGREALAEQLAFLKGTHWDLLHPIAREAYLKEADSLAPVIGGIVAAREEAIRKEGRQEVIDWIWHNHSKLYIDPGNLSKFQIEPTEWLMQLEAWGIT